MGKDVMNGKYWDKALSLVEGCTPVSSACEKCWLLAMGNRFGTNYIPPRIRPDRLNIPLKRKKPTVYAVWSDLFQKDVPDEFITKALCIMRTCVEIVPAKEHTFLILTKRPERMLKYFKKHWSANTFKNYQNIWFGVTAENQEQADKRIPILLQVPAVRRFVSIEPMLGSVDLTRFVYSDMNNNIVNGVGINKIDLVILGGESGHGARPMHPDWILNVQDQCEAAGVPFFFKQWGEWFPYKQLKYADDDLKRLFHCRRMEKIEAASGYPVSTVSRLGNKKTGRLLDGQEYNKLPWRDK